MHTSHEGYGLQSVGKAPALGRWIYAAAVVGVSGMAAALSGCNTVEGVGEDVEAAGDAIDEEAEEENF